MNKYWIYLVCASVLEVIWAVCVKYTNFSSIGRMVRTWDFNEPDATRSLIAFLGYIVFGVANIACFSKAMEGLGLSLAFACWTGLALIGTKAVDTFIFNEPWSHKQLVFIAMIAVGIVGLKVE